MRKMIALVCIAVAAVLCLSACKLVAGDDAGARPSADVLAEGATEEQKSKYNAEEISIGFISGRADDDFYEAMARGIEEQAAEFGIKKVLVSHPDTWDHRQQVPLIEEMVAREVDFLFIAPCDTEGLDEALRACADAQIPVVTLDTDVMDASLRLSNISTDNMHGGDLAAEYVSKYADRLSNDVAVISTQAETATTELRMKGFVNGCEARGLNVIREEYSGEDGSRAAVLAAEILEQNPRLAGLFGTNMDVSNGIAEAASGLEISADGRIICYDGGPEEVEALREGKISCIITQKPLEMGQIAVKLADYYFNGRDGDIAPQILTASVLATAENFEKPEVGKWFYRIQQEEKVERDVDLNMPEIGEPVKITVKLTGGDVIRLVRAQPPEEGEERDFDFVTDDVALPASRELTDSMQAWKDTAAKGYVDSRVMAEYGISEDSPYIRLEDEAGRTSTVMLGAAVGGGANYGLVSERGAVFLIDRSDVQFLAASREDLLGPEAE